MCVCVGVCVCVCVCVCVYIHTYIYGGLTQGIPIATLYLGAQSFSTFSSAYSCTPELVTVVRVGGNPRVNP